jgi:hypothetical protein
VCSAQYALSSAIRSGQGVPPVWTALHWS